MRFVHQSETRGFKGFRCAAALLPLAADWLQQPLPRMPIQPRQVESGDPCRLPGAQPLPGVPQLMPEAVLAAGARIECRSAEWLVRGLGRSRLTTSNGKRSKSNAPAPHAP